jgi:hypothetical protein
MDSKPSIEENLVNDVKCIDGKIVVELSMALNSFDSNMGLGISVCIAKVMIIIP